MKVAIIGDSAPPLDEGMKKTTASLAEALANLCSVKIFNPFQVLTIDFWSSLRNFQPQVIHYVPGPSLKSFILLTFIKRWISAKTVASVTHPDPDLPVWIVERFFKPDLLLLQSSRSQKQFLPLSCKKEFLPNGVDIQRYKPVLPAEKIILRQKYGIPTKSYVVLHVGNTRQIRNLECLIGLQKDNCQVVVVGSSSIQDDSGVADHLRSAHCIVIDNFIETIEEIFALADCYIFPTTNQVGAIEHPLSVLESMACNLPVVARRFGALPDFFQDGEGIYFAESDEDIVNIVRKLRKFGWDSQNRERMREFDWSTIANRLLALYQL